MEGLNASAENTLIEAQTALPAAQAAGQAAEQSTSRAWNSVATALASANAQLAGVAQRVIENAQRRGAAPADGIGAPAADADRGAAAADDEDDDAATAGALVTTEATSHTSDTVETARAAAAAVTALEQEVAHHRQQAANAAAQLAHVQAMCVDRASFEAARVRIAELESDAAAVANRAAELSQQATLQQPHAAPSQSLVPATAPVTSHAASSSLAEPPAQWVHVIRSLEQRVLATETQAAMPVPEDPELKMAKTRLAAALDDVTALQFENATLGQQLASLVAQHPTSGVTKKPPPPLKRDELRSLGIRIVPQLEAMRGAAYGDAVAGPEQLDLQKLCFDDAVSLVGRMREMARELMRLSQQLHDAEEARSRAAAGGGAADDDDGAATVADASGLNRSDELGKRHRSEAGQRNSTQLATSTVARARKTVDVCVATDGLRDLEAMLVPALPTPQPLALPAMPPTCTAAALARSVQLSSEALNATADVTVARDLERINATQREVITELRHAIAAKQHDVDRLRAQTHRDAAAIADLTEQHAAAAAIMTATPALADLVGTLQSDVAALVAAAETQHRDADQSIVVAADGSSAVARRARGGFSDAVAHLSTTCDRLAAQQRDVAAILQLKHQPSPTLDALGGGHVPRAAQATIAAHEATIARLQAALDDSAARLRDERAKAVQAMDRMWQLEQAAEDKTAQVLALQGEMGGFVPTAQLEAVQQQLDAADVAHAAAAAQAQQESEQGAAALVEARENSAALQQQLTLAQQTVADLEVQKQQALARAAEAESSYQATEATMVQLKHDTDVMRRRAEDANRLVAERDQTIAALKRDVNEMKGTLLTREGIRDVLATMFPGENDALLTSLDRLSTIADERARLVVAEVRLKQERDGLRAALRREEELNAERRRHIQELQVRTEEERADLEAQVAAADEALRVAKAEVSDLTYRASQAELDRNAAQEREAELAQKLAVLAADPAAANVRRYGLERTRDIQEQLEEMNARCEAAQANEAAAQRRVDELTEQCRVAEEARVAAERVAADATATSSANAAAKNQAEARLFDKLQALSAAEATAAERGAALEKLGEELAAATAQRDEAAAERATTMGLLEELRASHADIVARGQEADSKLRDAEAALDTQRAVNTQLADKNQRLVADNVAMDTDREKLREVIASLQAQLTQARAAAGTRSASRSGAGSRTSFAAALRSAQ